MALGLDDQVSYCMTTGFSVKLNFEAQEELQDACKDTLHPCVVEIGNCALSNIHDSSGGCARSIVSSLNFDCIPLFRFGPRIT